MSRIAPYIVIGLLLACIGAYVLGEHRGAQGRDTYWKGEIANQRAEAAEEASKAEHDKQEKVNDALRKQNASLAGINAGLARDLAELRNRPDRPMPAGAGSTCAGASGADLSRGDAELLVRLAARADRIRAALGACYEYADSLKQ